MEAVAAAVVTGIFTLVIHLSNKKLRRENSEQHAQGRHLQQAVLDRLDEHGDTLDRLDNKVDAAIQWQITHEKIHRGIAS